MNNQTPRIRERKSYSKICIICNASFETKIITSIYCSKKCGNIARTLPQDLKIALIKRNNHYTLATDVITAHLANGSMRYVEKYVPPQIDRSLSIKNATKSNPAGDDLGLLLEFARQKAVERGITPPELKKKDFINLDKESDIEFNLNVDNSIPDPDDDGLSGPSNNHTDKIESMTLADEPCPDCGSKHHLSCDNQAKPIFGIDQENDNSKQDVNKEEIKEIRKGIRKLGGGK